MIVILNFYREKIERKITKGERTWLEKNTSHLPSQSIDETSPGNSKIFINECVHSVSLNVKCVTNPLFFDTKLKDERSSIADNGSGSPLIYRVFLPTFVQLPTEMRFGASPVPQIEVAKIFFPLHGH